MIMTAFIRSKRLVFGGAAFAVVAAFVVWRVPRVSNLLEIGAGYTAQQTCACVFISGRTLASCVADLDPLAQRLLSVRLGEEEVTARAFGMGRAVARYEAGFGCSLRN
jgi:hypothetical protein